VDQAYARVALLAIYKVQTNGEGVDVYASRLGDTFGHLDGGLVQTAQRGLGIDATDAISREQSLDGRLAQLFSFGRRRRHGPKVEEPIGRNVIGELEQLRVIPPELVMQAIAKPDPFLLQLFGQARPFA
jgi:hypothetical protein